jgi:glycolate oxidase iron-sulfur subunit
MGPRGRIALLRSYAENELDLSEKFDQRLFSCLLCGACNSLCPLGINITDAIYDIRIRLKDYSLKRRLFSTLLKFSLQNPVRLFRLLKTIDEMIEIFPSFKKKIFRDFEINLPQRSLRDEMAIFKAEKTKGRVAIFAGCTVNILYPEIGKALIKGLNKLGYDVILPRGEICCGAPLMAMGLKEETKRFTLKNLSLFKNLNVEAIIGLCPTCLNFLKNEYKKIVGDSLDLSMDVSQFFLSRNLIKNIPKKNILKESVIYHDPCHSLYSLRIKTEPREVLNSLGLNLLNKQSGCCGFGGTFSLSYRKLSGKIVEERIEEYRNGNIIVTSCPNCIFQFRTRIKDKRILHIAEIIDRSLTSSYPS